MQQFDLFDTSSNSILQKTNYADFKKALQESNCTKCDLHKGRTHIVVDRGNPNASILIVGEGPGENEDLQGKAFVGRAGQLMDKLMKEIGLDTNQDCLIANVVKCRPPENRAPLKEEAETCLPFLKHQIELVKPRVMVLLGATALKHLLPKRKPEPMEKMAGQFFTDAEYPGVKLVVLYHPAFLLYDPRKRPIFMEHLKKLKSVLEETFKGEK